MKKTNDEILAMEALVNRFRLAIRLGHERLENKARTEILALYQGELTGAEVLSELKKGPLYLREKQPQETIGG